MQFAEEERSLGDALVRDVSPATDPQDEKSLAGFSFADFVTGVRRVRRSVTVYARGDLYAHLDVMRARIREAVERGDDTDSIDGMRAAVAETVAEMTAPGATIDIVVEGRSTEAVRRMSEDLEKRGIPEEEHEYHLVAAQIVEPVGASPELLAQFADVSEPQWRLIQAAAVQANTQPVGAMPDFLPAGSGAVRRKAS